MKWIGRIVLAGVAAVLGYAVYDYYAADLHLRPDMPEGAFSLSFTDGPRVILQDMEDESFTRRYLARSYKSTPEWYRLRQAVLCGVGRNATPHASPQGLGFHGVEGTVAPAGPRNPGGSFKTAISRVVAHGSCTVSAATSGALLATPFLNAPDAPSNSTYFHCWISVGYTPNRAASSASV